MRIPVLVVDDEYDIRMAVRLALELEGYMVFESPDGKPALERLREHPTGMVVLLDPQIPGVDGYAVLRAVVDHSGLATRHAYIVMSANAHDQLRTILQELAAFDVVFIPKPFDLEEVTDAVAAAAKRLSVGTV